MVTRVFIAVGGLVAILAVGYFGAFGGGQVASTPMQIQAELQADAERVLAERGLSWARVRMRGQVAILEGEAPREDERVEARRAVLTSHGGAGGFWAGGVTVVRDRTTLAPAASPYTFSATREGDRVTLNGYTPSRATREDLVDYARQLFPGGVVDNLQVARGAPDELAFVNAVRIVVTQLSDMRTGEVAIEDTRVRLDGQAASADAARRIDEESQLLPERFTLTEESVEAPKQQLAGAPETEEVAAELITSAQTCQALMAEVTDATPVVFGAGSAVIEKESYPVLDALVRIGLRCQGLRITAVGVAIRDAPQPLADAETSPRPNDPDATDLDLWADRAQAVADYFVLQGIARGNALAQAEREDEGLARLVLRVTG